MRDTCTTRFRPGQQALLRADPCWRASLGGRPRGGRVCELWVGMIRRCWPSARHRRSISSRYLSQDDRIKIADSLRRGELVTEIAARIGKRFQVLYRELHEPKAQRLLRSLVRAQPGVPAATTFQQRRFVLDDDLRALVADRLIRRWSPVMAL